MSSQLICSARAAHVSWDPSPNALSYAVEAISDGQTLTCNSSSPNCALSNLLCGQAYEIVVTATDGTCVSNYSAPFRQDQGTDFDWQLLRWGEASQSQYIEINLLLLGPFLFFYSSDSYNIISYNIVTSNFLNMPPLDLRFNM